MKFIDPKVKERKKPFLFQVIIVTFHIFCVFFLRRGCGEVEGGGGREEKNYQKI